MVEKALVNCYRANPRDKTPCARLFATLVHCQADVVCPDISKEYRECVNRVVSTQESYDACNDILLRMKACLKRKGVEQKVPEDSTRT